MAKQITLTVDGKPHTLQADFLKPGALEYWHAWLGNQARMAYNPLVEFAEKVQALPPDLQAVATREFMATLDFAVVPKIVLLATVRSLPAVKTLCILATGEDVITAANAAEAFPLLLPFIHREEIEVSSLAEVNRIRALKGKPPLGARPAAPAAPVVSDAGQPPQGG